MAALTCEISPAASIDSDDDVRIGLGRALSPRSREALGLDVPFKQRRDTQRKSSASLGDAAIDARLKAATLNSVNDIRAHVLGLASRVADDDRRPAHALPPLSSAAVDSRPNAAEASSAAAAADRRPTQAAPHRSVFEVSAQTVADRVSNVFGRRPTKVAPEGGGVGALSAQDTQQVVSRLTANKGLALHLKCEALGLAAIAQLKCPGPRFTVAGEMQLRTKVFDDGPRVMLEFSVPQGQAAQQRYYSESIGKLDKLVVPHLFDPQPFLKLMDVDQAELYLCEEAPPMWPCIN